jgi:hypothetical protein
MTGLKKESSEDPLTFKKREEESRRKKEKGEREGRAWRL